jgi:phosphoribosylglycinamide formyltransferase 1
MPAAQRLRLAVLISGQGSNMLAIARACASGQIRADVVSVISDQPAAGGLQRARDIGLPTSVVAANTFRDTSGRLDRHAFETALAAQLNAACPDLVALAGFMRILSATFIAPFEGRVLNIHPSLLPQYPGLETHARALAAAEKSHGASVHYVTPTLDGGPVILQARVPVLPGDDSASLSARVHVQEHIIYPRVIEWIAEGRLLWNGGHPLLDQVPLDAPLQENAS